MQNTAYTPKRDKALRRLVCLALCALFAALITVGAYIKIPVPMVPFTLQTLFVNLAALLLGKKWGAASAGLYVAMGLLGLPVFTAGGGLGYVLYPTFGYLLGFIAGNLLAGHIVERSTLSPFKRALAAGFANMAVVYALGLTYYWLIKTLYLDTPVGFWTMIVYCFLVFIPGDSLGCIVGALLYNRLHPLLRGTVYGAGKI